MRNQGLPKILMVDDEADIRKIAEIALTKIGHLETAFCSSGIEALATIDRIKPDLILLDMMMPELDGIETMHSIRALPEYKTTPILFITAKIQANEVGKYIELGANGVITKPFDPLTLASEILKIWHGLDKVTQ